MSTIPYRVEKPWGHELIWAHTPHYVGKVLHVRAGQVLSCQYHERKDETMHVLHGEVILRLWADVDSAPTERVMGVGESVHVTPGTIHSIEAVTDSDVLEASTSDLDDVVRLRDLYGRV
jgi:mannose-6-phosphate isomerase-like protein (cupin superfamily)